VLPERTAVCSQSRIDNAPLRGMPYGGTLTSFRQRIMARSSVRQIDVRPVGGHFKLDQLTVDTSGNYTRVSALLQNIAYLTQAIQQLQVASISYINFAGLISVGALTVGIIRQVSLVEILAPYGLSIVFIFLIQLYTDIERLITIREVLEEHANYHMPAPAFLGLNKFSSKYRGRLSVRLVTALLAIPLVLFGYHGIVAMTSLASPAAKHGHRLADSAVRHRQEWLEFFRYLNYVGLGLCFFILLWASLELILAHGRAVREVKETLGETPQSLNQGIGSADAGVSTADATNR
jgi:hypothetical protein